MLTKMGPRVRSVLWMIGAVVAFSGMALSVRELGSAISIYQILFLRCAIGLVLIVGSITATRGIAGLQVLRTGNLKVQFIRNMIHIVGQLLWIYAITVIPLALVFAVEFSAPLWTVLFGSLLLKEMPSRSQVLGVALGLVGILVILRPGPDGLSWAVLAVLLAAVMYAGAYLGTRVLSRTDAPIAIPFWMFLLQLPFGAALSMLDWRPIMMVDLPAILALAVTGLVAHVCLSSALRLAPLAQAIPIDYLRLPLIALIGAQFYGEAIDPFILLGGGIVLGSVILTQRTTRAKTDPVSEAAT